MSDTLTDVSAGVADLVLMKRHLRLLGWQVLEIRESVWSTLEDFEAKATYLEALLKTGGST